MTAPRRSAILLLLAALLPLSARAAVPEPSGYRESAYHATTPATLAGARVLTTAQARALWRQGRAAFIDVLPQAPRPAGLPPGTIWRDKPRYDIPGSIWLPDTGYGALAPAMQDYFVRNLRSARQRASGRLLVFYCQAECWMSWNATKRALALGFAPVAWYRDGTTGWQAAGLALERRLPEPRPVSTAP